MKVGQRGTRLREGTLLDGLYALFASDQGRLAAARQLDDVFSVGKSRATTATVAVSRAIGPAHPKLQTFVRIHLWRGTTERGGAIALLGLVARESVYRGDGRRSVESTTTIMR